MGSKQGAILADELNFGEGYVEVLGVKLLYDLGCMDSDTFDIL